MSTSLATRPRRLAPHLPSRPYLRRVTLHICEKTAASLPLPFCHAVYQDRLRKDVKKMIAVATVPFLSLISFQRCLSSAECSGRPPELPLRPSARCLHGAETGVGAGIRRRQTVMGGVDKINKSLLNRSVNTDLCAGSEKRLAVGGGSARTSQQQSRCVFPRRCSGRFSPAPPEPLYGDRSRVSCLPRRERLHGR